MGGIIAEHWNYDAAFWTVVLVNLTGVALYFLKAERFFTANTLHQ